MPDSPSLPPEWAPQSALLLTWPHPHGDWGDDLPEAERAFVAIARETATRQDLIIVCYDEDHRAHVAKTLAAAGVPAERTRLFVAPSNDIWARDHGPITVIAGGRPTLLDFRFNGWGRKYPYQLDDAVTARLHEQGAFGDCRRQAVSLVLEGGSIEVDGRGTLLTTISCLLSPERNPAYDCIGLEGRFGELFSIHRTLWLEHGLLEGDDTDGHIDTLARFCDPRTIAYSACDHPADTHYESLQAMARQLAGFTDAD
ncbi:MAG TPA: agmatine deiminase family protein, partial [Gammaproteobacteria bacterium]|nr:agmatine deiminase family protein [Gammaproteobacteria bacterium]